MTSDEADAAAVPESERDLAHGVVIERHSGDVIRINPVLWAEVQDARDDEKRRGDALSDLGPNVPLPFWLVFASPMYEALLYAGPSSDGIEELDDVPDVDDIHAWTEVDEDTLLDLARCVLIFTLPATLRPGRYMRGSLVRDLVARPLRPLRDWLEAYPHLVVESLGGNTAELPFDDDLGIFSGEERPPFWEVLVMPSHFEAPVDLSPAGAPDVWEGANRLGEQWFVDNGLDCGVDRMALARYGSRTIDAWRQSDFAPLMREAVER
jgi:hypothetical protein